MFFPIALIVFLNLYHFKTRRDVIFDIINAWGKGRLTWMPGKSSHIKQGSFRHAGQISLMIGFAGI